MPGPRRSASAGTGLGLPDGLLPSHGDYDQASRRASAPWHSPRPAGMSASTRWRTSTWERVPAHGDYRRAIDCLGQTVERPRRTAAPRALRAAVLPAVPCPCPAGLCHAELGAFAEGSALGDEGLRIAEAVAHPESLMWASCGTGLLYLRQGDLRRALPRARTGHGHLSGRGLPGLFPLDGGGPGGGLHPGWARRGGPAAAHAGAGQATATERVNPQPSVVSAWGRRRCWRPTWRRRTRSPSARSRWLVQHQERGHEAYALRLLGEIAAQRDSSGGRAGRSPLPPSPRPGRGAGHAPAPGPLPPGPGHAVCHDRPAGAGPRRASTAIEMYRAMEMTFWLPETEAALAQVEA